MTVTTAQQDLEALTLTIGAEFDAPAERVWELWSDPRQLERWWGPPTYPATFVEHDFVPGGRAAYFMTGPEGDKHHGWWRVEEIDAPSHLRLVDGFADDEGRPSEEMPTMTMTVAIDEAGGSTAMTIESRFASREDMDRVLEMGAEEGMKLALGQIDEILAAA